MNVMRRIKSIASGRPSVSSYTGFETTTEKFQEETERKIDGESRDRTTTGLEQHTASSSLGTSMSSSNPSSRVRTEWLGSDQLPKEISQMRIRDEKNSKHEKKDMEAAYVSGNGTETGQIICTIVGGRNGQPKQNFSYMTERIVGTGSFGVVYQAKCLETGEVVAIKKVLQDKRYKNRELQIMRLLEHPNVLKLKHCFFSTTEKDELYLNRVLDYVPETVHKVVKHYNRMNHQQLPIIYVQLYTYQICRALNYLHHVVGVCHRDIKPQNLPVPGEPNISYICSRYYRAPELIFGATEYTNAIDMWSVGGVG